MNDQSLNDVLCPCCSQLDYADCCQRYHLGALPETAEQLMRSRYTAFVRRDINYIIATTLPAQQASLDVAALTQWAQQMHWQGLQIVSHTPKIGKRHAQLHFVAKFTDREAGDVGTHDERSAFVKVNEAQGARWYFLDPTVGQRPTGKQPCLCGSGEKFKACCGKFL